MILALLSAEPRELTQGLTNDTAIVLEAKMQLLEDLAVRTDLEALASSLGTSYSRLRSVFKQETGFAPREFENMVRLNRARDLLISGDGHVSKVAETLGYSSVSYFSRAFRKAFDRSPQN